MRYSYLFTRSFHALSNWRRLRSLYLLPVLITLVAACGNSEPKQPDLPEQPDRWVSTIVLDPDTKAKYIGKTKNLVITSVSTVKDVEAPQTISIGDVIGGIRIGAIKCSFFWRDATYGGEQYMWRGRWGCQAGRNRQEVETAVGPDGEKRFDYVHVSPIRLESE